MKRSYTRYTAVFLVMFALGACTHQPPASVILHASRLKVQAAKNPYSVTVKRGDTLVLLSERYRVRRSEIISLNHLKEPYLISTGMVLKLPDPQYHIVQRGDTLYGIGRSYLVDVPTLIRVNHIENPEHILVGSRLYFSTAVAESHSPSLSGQENTPPETSLPMITSTGTSGGEHITVDELKPLSTTPSSAKDMPDHSSLSTPSGIASPATSSPVSSSADSPAAMASTESSHPLSEPPSPAVKPVKPVLAPADASASASVTSSEGFSWPVQGKIVSRFGPRKGGLYNDGINIAAPEGTKVKAASDGVVVYSGNELRGYGNLLLIKHDGGFVTAYAHTSKNLVQKDAVIRKGDTIAYVGKTGHVSSPQLHFSIRKDRKALNPEKYLPVMVSTR